MRNMIIALLGCMLLLACNSGKREMPAYEPMHRSTLIDNSLKEDSIKREVEKLKKEAKPAASSASKASGRRDNMRGWDPASEDDMDDNGMSRYMDNYDDEGWD